MFGSKLNVYCRVGSFSFMTYPRVCNKMGTTYGAGSPYPSEAPEFNPGFSGICGFLSVAICVVFCRSLLVLFRFAIVLSVFLRFADSKDNYHFALVSSNFFFTTLYRILWHFRIPLLHLLPYLSYYSDWFQ